MENTNKISQETQAPAKIPISASLRFTNMVIANFATNVTQGAFDLNDRQRRIIQGYFVVIDKTLKNAEEERLRKNASNTDHKWDNLIPYDWNHVNMTDLALDAVYFARMGLDMQEKNHLYPIPYANKKGGFYNITFMTGYSGIQYIADKYAADPPKSVTVEVVYKNDHFKPLKKSVKNVVESYEFDITNPFDRGDIIGGFGYLEYDEPAKNKLIIMTRADMDKRKPTKASANFWGGESYEYVDGKKQKVTKEGWQDEMYRKTLIREVYGSKHIQRDPSKIDDNYQYLREREVIYAQLETESEAHENANTTPIDLPQDNSEQSEPLPQEPQNNIPFDTEQPQGDNSDYTPPDM